MSRDLVFLQACPDDNYFIWMVHMWLESLRELNYSDKAVSLIFTPKYRQFNQGWKKLQELYPEAKFKFYKDDSGEISRLIGIYIPIIRPYCLSKYWSETPDIKNKAVFYCDCDILFTKNFNISHLLEDDICYLSDTNSYINASYFDNKTKDVIPEKLEEYKKRDILQETCSLVGISREIAEKNNEHSGGAQYFIKEIGDNFWTKVLGDCIKIRVHLVNINKEFFSNESKGFQSWTADMWAVLWNLWLIGKEVKIVPEMAFAWSTDPISKLDSVGIFHNAGITSPLHGTTPAFYKGAYHLGASPFADPYLEEVYNGEHTLCNHYYVKKMIELKEKYKL